MCFDYWSATHDILRSGGAPICPDCRNEMFAADDHGRFICFCNGLGGTTFDAVSGHVLPTRTIPQVDTTGMSEAEKAAIPPINRLDDMPTEAEATFIGLLIKGGPETIGSPEYDEARRKIEEERGR